MQPMPYYVRIARFMPRAEIVQKLNSTVRRLYIQGHNGKVCKTMMVWVVLVGVGGDGEGRDSVGGDCDGEGGVGGVGGGEDGDVLDT